MTEGTLILDRHREVHTMGMLEAVRFWLWGRLSPVGQFDTVCCHIWPASRKAGRRAAHVGRCAYFLQTRLQRAPGSAGFVALSIRGARPRLASQFIHNHRAPSSAHPRATNPPTNHHAVMQPNNNITRVAFPVFNIMGHNTL